MVNIVERCDDVVQIQNILVSVSDKSGLEMLIPGLIDNNPNVHFYSTGGTYNRIAQILGSEAAKQHLTQVSEYTGQPETQGGLVKTLDFKIYLGLLTETYNSSHQQDLSRTGAVPLDMVVVNLYPFKATIARHDVTVEEARANIDIGGPCMLRAAAKNYLRVVPVVDPSDYPAILEALAYSGGSIDLVMRFEFARKAFAHTAQYDTAISEYLFQQNSTLIPSLYTINSV
jgi:phosphoribosylaminoimidazolecarboxamide formyltransferase/IMP cyclohydrolase